MFFVGLINSTKGQTSFNLVLVWQRIISVSSPGETSIDPNQFTLNPTPVSQQVQVAIKIAKTIAIAKKVGALVIFLGTIALYPQGFFIALIVAAVLFYSNSENRALQEERRRRQAVLNDAEHVWDEAARRWAHEAGIYLFKNKLSDLVKIKREYESLDSELAREKDKLQRTIKQRQLRNFLDSFFIDDHTIPNIGPGRKATLASFGIETAADVDRHKIRRIKGFGTRFTNDLVQWRQSLESKFVFDPSKGVDPSDMAALNHRFNQRRAQVENALSAGPELLVQVRAEIFRKREGLRPEVERAARALAQARSDMSVVK
jgi:DNA-binding helix-hairpin-helix protein with protein kinase domain